MMLTLEICGVEKYAMGTEEGLMWKLTTKDQKIRNSMIITLEA